MPTIANTKRGRKTYGRQIREYARKYGRKLQLARRPKLNGIYRCSDYTGVSTFTQTATTDALFGINFAFGNLTNSTAMIALFDDYKIEEVILTFRPHFTELQSTSSAFNYANEIMPNMYLAIDTNDATTPATLSAVAQYSNVKIIRWNQHYTVRIRPHVLTYTYVSGIASGYANAPSGWIDTTYDAVKHYGLKIAIEAGRVGQTILQTWTMEQKYIMSFRNRS